VASPPLRDGAVAVSDGRVTWVGPRGDAPAGEVRDLGAGVLLPGLVNAHCHLELSWLAGRLPAEAGFVPWVEALVDARAREEPERVRRAAEDAIAELWATGTVAVGDVSNALPHLDLLERSPLRAVVFLELLGWDPGACDRAWSRALALRAHAGSGGTRVRVRLAAHAPHSVSPPLLDRLRADGGPAAIHLAEAEAETRFLLDGGGEWRDFLERRGLGQVAFTPPGTSPVRYLDRLGALPRGLVAAHCVRVDAGDARLLAERGVHAVLCPRSNQALAVGLPALPQLLRAGVPVALGTDSLASAPSLDLLQDAAVLHHAFPEVPPATLVRAATLGGAEALGLDELGAIVPGRRPALAFAAAPDVPPDPLAFLVSGAARAAALGIDDPVGVQGR
jgi:cytosine/adenosine deaminase-related metal-dependent hydrolase